MADKFEIGDEMLTQVSGGAEAATAEATFAEKSREIRERFIAKYGLSAVVKALAAHPEIVEMLEDENAIVAIESGELEDRFEYAISHIE